MRPLVAHVMLVVGAGVAMLLIPSCSVVYKCVMTGRVENVELLGGRNLRFTFEPGNYDNHHVAPDSMDVHADGTFRLRAYFRNTYPESFSVWAGDSIVARYRLWRSRDSIAFIDPFTGGRVAYEFDGSDDTPINGFVVVPRLQPDAIAMYNVDELLREIRYTDSALIFTFSSIPPPGSSLFLYGGTWNHDERDTTVAIAGAVVTVSNRLFWHADSNRDVFLGGAFYTPYGWHRSFFRQQVVGYRTR